MKKIVFIIILGLLWTTIPVEAQRRPGHREQYEYSQGRPRLQYVIGHNAVLFDGKVIRELRLPVSRCCVTVMHVTIGKSITWGRQ